MTTKMKSDRVFSLSVVEALFGCKDLFYLYNALCAMNSLSDTFKLFVVVNQIHRHRYFNTVSTHNLSDQGRGET